MTLKSILKNPKKAELLTRKEFDAILDNIDAVYYNEGKKPITDDEYDLLMDIYSQRFPKSTRLKRVGAKVGSKRAEVPLPSPMSSLDKIKTEQRIAQFAQKFPGPYVLSDKMDGMSLQLVYDGGKPVELYTRGDGLKGQDISHLIPHLRIPKRVPVDHIVVRVEAIVSNKKFDNYLHEDVGGKFTAVRNAAGGIINKLPSSKDYVEYVKFAKHMDLVAFKILAGTGSKFQPSKQFKLLQKYGFATAPNKIVKTINKDTLSAFLAQRIKNNDYEIDGIVVEQDQYHPVGHSIPKHAVSFKENSIASMVDVVCTGVTWDVSRTGKIIPQVNIKPTRIGGVTVSNFTGHNAFYIQHGYLKGSPEDKRGEKPRPIGKGAILKAVRSGQVIPYIVEVVKGARRPDMPSIEYVQKGVHLHTAGADDTQKIKRIEHFFTKIGVTGFKQSTIQRFWDNGYRTLSRYLGLKVSDFEAIDGLGKQKAAEFLQSLRASLNDLTFAKLADASGYFPNFGQSRLALISETYPDIMEWNLPRTEVISRVQAIRGFKEIARDFATALPKLQKFARTYDFRIKVKKIVRKSNKLADLRVTFTGVRDADLAQHIEVNGGKVQDMRKDTNVVVVKDLSFSSSKVDRAREQGIPVLTLDQFKRKYGA